MGRQESQGSKGHPGTCYSQSLWNFHCSLLHGRTKEEAYQHQLSDLQSQVAEAYAAYTLDQFIIKAGLQHIFLTPLSQHLRQDIDSLRCFVATYRLGVQEQAQWTERQTALAKNFFFARSLLVIITIEVTDDVSSYSGVTSVLAQWTQIR